VAWSADRTEARESRVREGKEKTYYEKIMGASSLVGVDFERKCEKVAKDGGQRMLFLDGRRAIRGNQPQCTERALVEVRRLALNHFNGHDAQGPDIHLSAVLFPRHDFGGHPVGSTDHGGALIVAFIDLRAETKVGYTFG